MREKESRANWLAAIGTALAGIAAIVALFVTSPDTVVIVPAPIAPPGAATDAAPLERTPTTQPLAESAVEPKSLSVPTGSTPPSATAPPLESEPVAEIEAKTEPEVVVAQGAMSIRAAAPMLLEPKQRVPGRFRIVLRLFGAYDKELPVTLVSGKQAHVLDWIAVTSGGAQCKLHTRYVNGIDIFSAYNIFDKLPDVLNEKAKPRSTLSRHRPTVVVADFDCDERVLEGDTASLQLKFYLKTGDNWQHADYAFDVPAIRG